MKTERKQKVYIPKKPRITSSNVEEIMAFNKEILEKFPVTRMKLLHRNLISVSEELYELSETLDSENTYTNNLKDINNSLEAMCRNDIEETLRRISNICSLLSRYTLSDKEN